MPAFLLPLLLKLLPWLAGIIGVITLYFGIKRKGVTEERQRQETKRVAEVKQIQQKVDVAVSQDAAIDRKVVADVQRIKDIPKLQNSDFKPGVQFKF